MYVKIVINTFFGKKSNVNAA